MLILLPPSEGKAAADRGPRLTLRRLSFPALSPERARILDALVALSGRERAAMSVLGLGPTQGEELARNRALRTAPCGPAVEVYTGVLYEALDVGSLTAAQRARLVDAVAIGSALWGLVRADDPIPAYRLSGETTLPGLGPIAAQWKAPVTDLLAEQPGPILDLRSGAYQFGTLPVREDVAVGRVLLERNGRRSVVSHHNKATKGRAVRALVSSRRAHRSLDDIAATLASAGMRCELHCSTRGAQTMDIVTREL